MTEKAFESEIESNETAQDDLSLTTNKGVGAQGALAAHRIGTNELNASFYAVTNKPTALCKDMGCTTKTPKVPTIPANTPLEVKGTAPKSVEKRTTRWGSDLEGNSGTFIHIDRYDGYLVTYKGITGWVRSDDCTKLQ